MVGFGLCPGTADAVVMELIVEPNESLRRLVRDARDADFGRPPPRMAAKLSCILCLLLSTPDSRRWLCEKEDRDAIGSSSLSKAKESNEELRRLLLDRESRDSPSLKLERSKSGGGGGGGGGICSDALDDIDIRELLEDHLI